MTDVIRQAPGDSPPSHECCHGAPHVHDTYIFFFTLLADHCASGEKFYLPQKWKLCPTTSDDGKTTQRRYKECGINYSFKPDEMKGGDLMKNLRWLGQFGRLRTLLHDEVNDDNNNDDDNDEDAEEQSDLIGGGGPPRKRQRRNDASYKFEEERNI